jgi:hypothetical protein
MQQSLFGERSFLVQWMPNTFGILLLLWILRLLFFNTKRTADVPSFKYGSIPGVKALRGMISFVLDPRKVLLEGYLKYKGGYFRVRDLHRRHVIVCDRTKMAEYLAAPDSVLTLHDVIVELLQANWTLSPGTMRYPVHVPLTRTRLMPNLSNRIVPANDETRDVLDILIGAPQSTTSDPP